MPLDAICLEAVVKEIAPRLLGNRIDKIQMPARDQAVLLLRGKTRLLLCANPNQPRLHFTEQLRDNPSQPPMFCMLLRKHLGGGRIVSVEQVPRERVVILGIEAVDELGEPGRYELILEAMGRHSNLILCDGQRRILDCLRRVDFEMSPDRQVLPGLYYQLPTPVKKRDPLTVEEADFLRLLPEEAPLDRWLTDTFNAISPLIARELVYRAYGAVDVRGDGAPLWDAFSAWREAVAQERFMPLLLERGGTPGDFSYCPILQYEGFMESRVCESFSQLLDSFYEEREQQERVRQRGRDLLKAATNAVNRTRRKIASQELELERTKNRDRWRICGELITANLYRMQRGAKILAAENYYAEGCPEITIPLDERLTPQENAAKYFKQYTKAKTAQEMLTRQLEKNRAELTYLESVVQELALCESEQDFNDVRAELTEAGILRGRGKKQAGFQRQSKPREFRTTAGLRVLVGRSNAQNDKLTTKLAQRGDIWLHTKKIHGSHVILCTEGAEPDAESLRQAAVLAAWYSQGREGGKVEVDYTPVKYVKKPAGARPGMVTYTTCKTLAVTPDRDLVKALQA